MKKTIYGIAAAFAVVALASCGGNNGKCGGDKCAGEKCDKDKVEIFTGILPGADVENVKYVLSLDFDCEDNCTKGDYDLVETYLEADSTSTTGFKDLKSFKSEGDFTVTEQNGQKVFKLVAHVKDSQPGSNVGPMYFVLDNDSTLTMVNDQLERAANPDMNYSLKLNK